jgi:hypothetical protein
MDEQKLYEVDFPEKCKRCGGTNIKKTYSLQGSLFATCQDCKKSDLIKLSEQAANVTGRVDIKSLNSPECPYCHGHSCKKISAVGRMVSTSILGLGSSKIGKQWHCNKCGSNF